MFRRKARHHVLHALLRFGAHQLVQHAFGRRANRIQLNHPGTASSGVRAAGRRCSYSPPAGTARNRSWPQSDSRRCATAALRKCPARCPWPPPDCPNSAARWNKRGPCKSRTAHGRHRHPRAGRLRSRSRSFASNTMLLDWTAEALEFLPGFPQHGFSYMLI